MRWKIPALLSLLTLFVCAALRAAAQSPPAAVSSPGFSPLAIGAGFSDFNIGWTNGNMQGGTLWFDYTPEFLPHPLRGLGVEAMLRDLSIETRPKAQFDMREDVASGGVIYSLPRYRRFRPYAKYLMGFGNDDYPVKNNMRYHQTRTVTSVGGGLDCRVSHSVWARIDYEYQFWPDFFIYAPSLHKSPGILSPYGFTYGVMYHF
ncbi:MAG TPA: outer membrane beta-barrel protein [Terracidiphilus sp.]|jgi:opacity protein-like surface antigen